MKLINFIVLFLMILACSESEKSDYRRFTITEFSNKRVDTLIPYENKTYVGYYIKVKGIVDDTIIIERDEHYYFIIPPGEVDTLLNGDYYGTENIIWTFNPYKATKGELEIEYSL